MQQFPWYLEVRKYIFYYLSEKFRCAAGITNYRTLSQFFFSFTQFLNRDNYQKILSWNIICMNHEFFNSFFHSNAFFIFCFVLFDQGSFLVASIWIMVGLFLHNIVNKSNSCGCFSLPLQIGIALYLLYTQVKFAFLSGLAITILLIPGNIQQNIFSLMGLWRWNSMFFPAIF